MYNAYSYVFVSCISNLMVGLDFVLGETVTLKELQCNSNDYDPRPEVSKMRPRGQIRPTNAFFLAPIHSFCKV